MRGRAGMATLRARTRGTRAGGDATAAHEAVPEWVAPFDVASLAAQQHCVWPSDPYGGVWYVSEIMGNKWSCILEEEPWSAFHFLVSSILLSVRW